MKKFLTALLAAWSMLVAPVADAEIQTYEGSEDYYVLGAVEDVNVARERARERAIRNAREKAGVYVHSYSRTKDFELVDDEVITVASGVLRVIETHYETKTLPDASGYLIRATVKADIDTDDLLTWFQKDAEEVIKLIAEDKAIRAREAEQERKIETLKQEYVQAATPEQKEVIAAQIVEQDKTFLSNLKLREGNRQRDAGNHKRAAEFFTAAIDLNPSNVMAWRNRGWAYAEQKKYSQALADFNKAVEMEPDSEFAYLGRGYVYHRQKKYSAAVAEYTKAIELNPACATAYNNRGAALSWQDKMHEAIADYNKAVELNPRYAKAYENRGKAYEFLGDAEKSAADLSRAKQIKRSDKGVDKIIAEAESLRKAGKFTEALELYNQAAETYPDSQNIYVNRGNIYNDDLQDYDAAIADYNAALAINPRFARAYLNRGLAYNRLDKRAEAIADFDKAIELAPNFALAYNNRAWTNYELGNYDESIIDADKALKLKPNEVMFYDTRACAYKGLQRYDDALADLDKAIQISAEGWLFKRRAEIYQLVGDEAKAQADFDEAARLG